MNDWLEVRRGTAPLIVSMPHTGTEIPREIEERLVSPWIGRRDADWWIEKLYDFAGDLGATIIRTHISRTVIDCNRDPSGASLYPGQNTTELCPTTTFDGEPLYRGGSGPVETEIAYRRETWFAPYHAAIVQEVARLREQHPIVVLYDAHSIRSRIPRLFDGELPNFNIGTNSGASCAPALTAAIESVCDAPPFTRVTNGRFKGGYTTRHYGKPAPGIHTVQIELACRGYMDEPDVPDCTNWPTPYDAARVASMRMALINILTACIDFADSKT